MNEPSNFVNGSVEGCTNSTLDDPPYTPGMYFSFALALDRTVNNHIARCAWRKS
jgi:hypothetical protein